MKYEGNIINKISLILAILIPLVSFYYQFKNPQTGLILFIMILVFIFLYFLLSYPINVIIKKFKQIDKNTERYYKSKKI